MKPVPIKCTKNDQLEFCACEEGLGVRISGINQHPHGAYTQVRPAQFAEFIDAAKAFMDEHFERYGDTYEKNGRAA
jgi:hypothetical protein